MDLRPGALAVVAEDVVHGGYKNLRDLKIERVVFVPRDDEEMEALSREVMGLVRRMFPRAAVSLTTTPLPIKVVDAGTGDEFLASSSDALANDHVPAHRRRHSQ